MTAVESLHRVVKGAGELALIVLEAAKLDREESGRLRALLAEAIVDLEANGRRGAAEYYRKKMNHQKTRKPK